MDDPSPKVLIGVPARGTTVLGIPLVAVARRAPLGVPALAALVALGRFWPLGAGLEIAGVVVVRLGGWHPLLAVRLALRRRRSHPTGISEREGVLEVAGRGSAVVTTISAPVAGLAPLRRSEDLARIVTEAASRVRPGDRLVLTSVISPELALRDPTSLDATSLALAAHAYRVRTRLVVASPRPGRRTQVHLRHLALGLDETSARLEALRVAAVDEPLREVVGSLGRMGSLDGRLEETPTALLGPGFAARSFVVGAWPRQPIDPGVLRAVCAPGPPARLVALVMAPLEPRTALARVGRHRTELAADRLLRRERGFLQRSAEAFEDEASRQLDQDLAGGYRLCRHQLVLIVLAPEARLLARSEQELLVRAARAHLGLRRVDGGHREAFELVLAGVSGWT